VVNLRETLEQLPDSYDVILKPKGGSVTYTDTAGRWLEDDGRGHRLEDFELVSEIVLPRESAQSETGPTDLRQLMSGDPPEEEWMVEPVLPRGKLVGFVSRRGQGKSLFLLDLVVNLAAGQKVLDQPASDPVNIVYLDMEMGPEDLYDRMVSLGWTPENPLFDVLCAHLHYYQLVTMPPLDTKEGGEALEALVIDHKASLVVVDTVSRVISGEENAAEPFRDLFRHTETRLKRRGVTLARLDHLGKDTERGSRGSSAKEDPLDVVWHMTQMADDSLALKLTKGRQDWVPRQVTVNRAYQNGVLVHEVPPQIAPDWLLAIADNLDGLGLDTNVGVNAAHKALQEADMGAQKRRVGEAVKFRKRRENIHKVVPDLREPPESGRWEPGREPPGTTSQETLGDLGEHNGQNREPPGNHLEPVVPGWVPSKRGNHPATDPSEPVENDDLPDPW
jgi:hypothetical protein